MSERKYAQRLKQPVLLLALPLALAGCKVRGDLLSPPNSGAEVVDPRGIVDFTTLYATNCAGCHGASGRGGAAIELASAGYLSLVDETDLRQVIEHGRPDTAMPAFAQSAGGMLSDLQVGALVQGILAWAKKSPGESAQPSYRLSESGDAIRGARVFANRCASCHGADGRGSKNAGSIVDQDFLELVSEQWLRTSVIAGRPDLGCPDWHGVDGRMLSSEDVSDTVAWLWSHRRQSRPEPYRSARADERKP
ncbi:MAG TPA: c-type cytochrome [Polyangiaceae bacterium]|jgi:cytochrome c oxidase cbb3-type subunit 3|nr:c-type cytochrome [Polyangiaceae bacterium]